MFNFTLGSGRANADISQVFDVVVIGGGPGGLSAAMYAGRYSLKTLLIEKKVVCGGQMATISSIENYPGLDKPVSGSHLAGEMESQAVKMDVKILHGQVTSVNFADEIKELNTPKGLIRARTVIICTGAQPRMLDVPGEKEHMSKGVSYCATCDGHLYLDKTIAVVGGGNTALEETVTLSKFAKKIFLIHRREEFRADKLIRNKVKAVPKIEFLHNATVRKIDFSHESNKHILVSVKGEERTLDVDGIFIFVGIEPHSGIFGDTLKLKYGFIVTDEEMGTNVEGVFAAGDIRSKNLRQIATAVGDGAIAAFSAAKYLAD
ncbi:MAG: FAD-dependent oxidoreductase [Candidatus Omnitrophica bacterium]|nr:FAD-dependent oxidoreductase [Candidatus Omnitrophota bacterium]